MLLVIADAANSDGEHAHPGLDNIVADSLYSRSTVLATIAELEAAGWLEQTSKCAPGRATVHRIPMGEQVHGSDPSQVQGPDPSRVQESDPSERPTGPISVGNRSDFRGQQVRFPVPTPSIASGVVTRGTAAAVPAAGLSPVERALAVTTNRAPIPATDSPRRDLLWEAVMEVCGIDTTAIPKSARGAYNRAVADLRAIGATPDEVRARGAAWNRNWRAVTMTPTALVRRWGEIPMGAPVSRSMSALQTWAAEG